MKTLSIGRLNYDINLLMENYPLEGTESITKEMLSCSGGSANVVAYALGKWNMESYISGVVGYDEIGNTMKKNMEENRVKTTYLETNYDIKTPTTYIITNKQAKTRTSIIAELNPINIRRYDYDQAMDCIIVDGYELNASTYAFQKFSNAISILNAKTPRNALLDYFKYAKYVVCSQSVAESITGMKIDFANPATMTTIYKRIIDKYPHITLLITMPEKGTIYSLNNEIKVLASMQVEVVDKTGADDIFVAMIGYGLTNTYDIETTIRLATIAESMAKKTMGATLSIPILSDIIKYYESKFGKLKDPNSNSPEIAIETPVPQTEENRNQLLNELKETKPVSEPQREIVGENNKPIEEPLINPFAGTIINSEPITSPISSDQEIKNNNNDAPTS